MFDVSFTEVLVIMAVVLLVFGPEKLPEAARRLGDIVGQLRGVSNTMRREFYHSLYTPLEQQPQPPERNRPVVEEPHQQNAEEQHAENRS